jgi:hypothetical protein
MKAGCGNFCGRIAEIFKEFLETLFTNRNFNKVVMNARRNANEIKKTIVGLDVVHSVSFGRVWWQWWWGQRRWQ